MLLDGRWGDDAVSGKNFDHRKVWIEDYLHQFAAAFGIDLLGFAILSNHFHLILRSRPDVVATWDDREVARRWLMLCPYRRSADSAALPPTESEINSIANCPVKCGEIRKRLSNIGRIGVTIFAAGLESCSHRSDAVAKRSS